MHQFGTTLLQCRKWKKKGSACCKLRLIEDGTNKKSGNLVIGNGRNIEIVLILWWFVVTGNGRNIDIYDGRRSLAESQKEPSSIKTGGLSDQNKLSSNNHSERGEIHYVRDSDDEQPDSDEDPDDDLDI